MRASGWPITTLLLCLFGSATSSPVSTYTPAPPLPVQISPPSPAPTILPSLPSPSLGVPPTSSPPDGNSGESTEKNSCHLTVSPSTVVVRFEDSVTANCSVERMNFSLLGWEVGPVASEPTMHHFIIWHMDKMTEWSLEPKCYASLEQGGPCHINLPLIVYKPPDNVSISIDNHTGPMIEGHQYTLHCTVQDVAPVENLTVTFYRGDTVLAQLRSENNTEKTPANESFSLNIIAGKEDDGVQYRCEAKLELGPHGPQHPPVVVSQALTAAVLFGPQLGCPTKLKVREGESVSCEVRGNPQPLVTWYRDGQVVVLPTSSNRNHAGKYTVLARGDLEQKNFTVEVEVLGNNGTLISYNGHFLLAFLLIQMIHWL